MVQEVIEYITRYMVEYIMRYVEPNIGHQEIRTVCRTRPKLGGERHTIYVCI